MKFLVGMFVFSSILFSAMASEWQVESVEIDLVCDRDGHDRIVDPDYGSDHGNINEVSKVCRDGMRYKGEDYNRYSFRVRLRVVEIGERGQLRTTTIFPMATLQYNGSSEYAPMRYIDGIDFNFVVKEPGILAGRTLEQIFSESIVGTAFLNEWSGTTEMTLNHSMFKELEKKDYNFLNFNRGFYPDLTVEMNILFEEQFQGERKYADKTGAVTSTPLSEEEILELSFN